jgi:hypothetical protein
MRSLRSYLQEIEFADISFHYRLQTPRVLPPFPELTLRPALHKAGMERLDPTPFEQLFTPPLPADPTALQRYQRPAPPFAFQPRPLDLSGAATEQGIIDCRLFGDGISLLYDLIITMQGVQPYTFANNQQEGLLVAVSAVDASGQGRVLWEKGRTKCADPPRITAAWRFDPLPVTDCWQLEIFTPARLLVQGKPLFRPDFRHLLPFILRRVTANCYFCHHIEIAGATDLLALSADVQTTENHLQWHDWRSQAAGGTLTGLGGVWGSLLLTGYLPDDLIDLIRLGSLLNMGKGAAYGAGAFRLIPV